MTEMNKNNNSLLDNTLNIQDSKNSQCDKVMAKDVSSPTMLINPDQQNMKIPPTLLIQVGGGRPREIESAVVPGSPKYMSDKKGQLGMDSIANKTHGTSLYSNKNRNNQPRINDYNAISQKSKNLPSQNVNGESVLIDEEIEGQNSSQINQSKQISSQVINQRIGSQNQSNSKTLLENPSEIYAMGQVLNENYLRSSRDYDNSNKKALRESSKQLSNDNKLKNIQSIYKTGGSAANHKQSGEINTNSARYKKNSNNAASQKSSQYHKSDLGKITQSNKNITKGMDKNFNSSALLQGSDRNLSNSNFGHTEKRSNVDQNILQNVSKKKFIQFSNNSGLASNQNLSMYSKKSQSKNKCPLTRSSMNSDLFDNNVKHISSKSPRGQTEKSKMTKKGPKAMADAAKSHLTGDVIAGAIILAEDNNLKGVSQFTVENQKQSKHIVSQDSLNAKAQLQPEYYVKTEYETNQSYYNDENAKPAMSAMSNNNENQADKQSSGAQGSIIPANTNISQQAQQNTGFQHSNRVSKADTEQQEDFKEIERITNEAEAILTQNKFDLCAWGSTTSYNQAISKEGFVEQGKLKPLPEDCLVIIAGNSRSIWETIQKFKSENSSENPFDEFSAQIAKQIQDNFKDQNIAVTTKFANEVEPETLVSFSRLVREVSFGEGAKCYFQNDVHLLFHEKYGNWHAWRFALVFENIFLSAVPSDPTVKQYIAQQNLYKNQVKLKISETETLEATQLTKQGQEAAEFNKDTSHIWLKIRRIFKLGKEYQYPKEMLQYHYKSVKEEYFEEDVMSKGVTATDQYSDEDFENKTDTISKSFGNTQRKGQGKSMNSTAPINLGGLKTPITPLGQDRSDILMRRDEAPSAPNQKSSIQGHDGQSYPAQEVYSSNFDQASRNNIFEKSPRPGAPGRSNDQAAQEGNIQLGEVEFQDDDDQKDSGYRVTGYTSPFQSINETNAINKQNEKADKVLASSAFIPASPKEFNQNKLPPNYDERIVNNKMIENGKPNQSLMNAQTSNFNSKILKQDNILGFEQTKPGGLKFQFINKQKMRDLTPPKLVPNADAAYAFEYQDQPNDDDATKNISTRRITVNTQDYEQVAHIATGDHSIFTSKLDFNPRSASNRQPYFVNTMRKTNIKYPFGYHKKQRFQAMDTENPGSPNGVSSIDQANTLQPFQQAEDQMNNSYGVKSGPVTSKSQATVGVRPKPGQNHNNNSNSLYNLSKIQNLRNSQSNYMGQKPQQPAPISVHDFLNSQLSKRIRCATNQSNLHKSNQTTINQQSNAFAGNKFQHHGTHRAAYDQAVSDNSNSRSPMYRNRFMPKFYKGVNKPSIMGLTANGAPMADQYQDMKSESGREQVSFTVRNDETQNLQNDSQINQNEISQKTQNYTDDFSSKPPFEMYGSLVIGKHKNSCEPDMTAQELKQRFQSTYAGISKNEIVRRPANEIFQQIKRNLSHQSREMHDIKMRRMKQKIQSTQEYLKIKKCFDIAKKRYLKNKDDESLKMYQNWQTQLNMWQVSHQNSKANTNRANYFELYDDPNRSVQSSYKEINKVSNTNTSQKINFLNIKSVKTEESKHHHRQLSPMIPPIIAESSQSITQLNNFNKHKMTQMTNFYTTKQSNAPKPQNFMKQKDNSISQIYCKQGMKQNILKAKSNQLLNSKMGQSKQYSDNHSKFMNKRIQKYPKETVVNNDHSLNRNDAKPESDEQSNIFLQGLQDAQYQREGLQTAPANSKKRSQIRNQSPPEVSNALEDYQNQQNNLIFQNKLNVISEQYTDDNRDKNILTYEIPEHDMSLDFKSNILISHPDNLGQDEPNAVSRVISQLSRENDSRLAAKMEMSLQASKYYNNKKRQQQYKRTEAHKKQNSDIVKEQQYL